MARKTIWLLTAGIGLTSAGNCNYAAAANAPWLVRETNQHTYMAFVSADFPALNGTMTGILSVEEDPAKNCASGIELALLHGHGYGNPLGKVPPDKTAPLDVQIDGKPLSVDDTYWIKYDNGFSAIASINAAQLSAVANGKAAVAVMVPGSPRFEFDIAGADLAIDSISKQCNAALVRGTG